MGPRETGAFPLLSPALMLAVSWVIFNQEEEALLSLPAVKARLHKSHSQGPGTIGKWALGQIRISEMATATTAITDHSHHIPRHYFLYFLFLGARGSDTGTPSTPQLIDFQIRSS